MQITTFQDARILDEIEDEGTAFCHSRTMADSCESFHHAYAWMGGKMRERIGSPGREGVKYPLWGWVQEVCSRKPVTPDSSYFTDGVDRIAMITADIPEDLLLLSDFTQWHCVLNKAMCGDDRLLSRDIDRFDNGRYTPFEAYPDELRSRITASWDGIFNLDSRGKGHPKRRNRSIQCCFWELRKEWIRDVRILESKAFPFNPPK